MACVPPQKPFLLDKAEVQNSDICEVLSAFDKVPHSTTTALRGIERGKDILFMFEFKLKKKSLKGRYLKSEEGISWHSIRS